MEALQILTSVASGGLSGATVSLIANRRFHQRSLRTRFFPKLQSFWGEYVLRMEKPEGRYWITKVGYMPTAEDEQFVDHRGHFIDILVEFNELAEARKLRKHLISNLNPKGLKMGEVLKTDLLPEYEAVDGCFNTLHKKLRLQ